MRFLSGTSFLPVLAALFLCTVFCVSGVRARPAEVGVKAPQAQGVKKNPEARALFQQGFSFAHGRGNKRDLQKAVACYEEAARLNYAPAQYNLARMYLLGNGVKQNAELALLYFEKAAEQGLLLAQYNLAVLFETGEGCDKDLDRALNWYQKAAEQGDSEAQFRLGLFYEEGMGTAKDLREALSWYLKAAKQGNPRAQNNAGAIFERGGENLPPNQPHAVYWYHKAAVQGHALAQYNLSQCYEYGRGVVRNEHVAHSWRERARAHGLDMAGRKKEGAKSEVRERTLSGANVSWKDRSRKRIDVTFRELDERSPLPAEREIGEARGRSGKIQKEGDPPLKARSDGEWSVRPMDRASEQRARELYRQGLSYEQGQGSVRKNWKKAVDCYREAAKLKYAPAAFKLGCVYDVDGASDQDLRTAWKWFSQSANGGHAGAQYRLGRLYELGRGTPGNMPLASFWYAQAAAQGDAKAKQALRRVQDQDEKKVAPEP